MLRDRDEPDWIDDSVPDDVLGHMHVQYMHLVRTSKVIGSILNSFLMLRPERASHRSCAE